MWGATIFDFGKHKGSDMTYSELCGSRQTNPNAENYVKRVMSHGEKSSGQLHDLFEYASALMKSHGVNVQGSIPGTKEPRRLKSYN